MQTKTPRLLAVGFLINLELITFASAFTIFGPRGPPPNECVHY
jgi:hypothetical protein